MQATQNFSTKNRRDNAVYKNTALPDSKKVNSQTDSKYGKSKSTTNLKGEHQRSENQNISFPESDHQKNQEEPHKKDVAKKQAKIKSKNINFHENKEFEKIQSHDSSETTVSHSHSSHSKSSASTEKNDLLQEKSALDGKIKRLKEKQETTKNKASRDYENRGRELEILEEELKSINNKLGMDNSYLSASPAFEKLDSSKTKKTEETSSKINFDSIVEDIQSIEDEIREIEKNNDRSKKTESEIIKLKEDRDFLLGLMEKLTEIFETEKE